MNDAMPDNVVVARRNLAALLMAYTNDDFDGIDLLLDKFTPDELSDAFMLALCCLGEVITACGSTGDIMNKLLKDI